MKSLSKIVFLSGLLFSIFSCQKKYETCSHSIYYIPFGIGFIGYDSSEVQTLVLEKYPANANFANLISTDTLTISNFKKLSDTLLDADYRPFLELKIGFDYKLILVPINKTVTISNIEQGPTADTFRMEHCSPGAFQPRFYPYTKVVVDGTNFVPVYSYIYSSSKTFLYLKK